MRILLWLFAIIFGIISGSAQAEDQVIIEGDTIRIIGEKKEVVEDQVTNSIEEEIKQAEKDARIRSQLAKEKWLAKKAKNKRKKQADKEAKKAKKSYSEQSVRSLEEIDEGNEQYRKYNKPTKYKTTKSIKSTVVGV